VTTAAKDFIIDSAYDSVYGARPIKRFIQSHVETMVAKAIIRGQLRRGRYPDGGLPRRRAGAGLSAGRAGAFRFCGRGPPCASRTAAPFFAPGRKKVACGAGLWYIDCHYRAFFARKGAQDRSNFT
jgi:hypothetical protein